MKKLKEKDKKKRKLVLEFNNYFFCFKNILLNYNILFSIKLNALQRYVVKPINSSITRTINRCILSNKSSVAYKQYKLSRYFLLKLIRVGQIYGIRKFN